MLCWDVFGGKLGYCVKMKFLSPSFSFGFFPLEETAKTFSVVVVNTRNLIFFFFFFF